jgi:hypothetical protein
LLLGTELICRKTHVAFKLIALPAAAHHPSR